MEVKAGRFSGWFKKYSSSDVIIAGAGPAGLIAALDLARLNLKTLVVERNQYAGGRLWWSEFLVSTAAPASEFRQILDELNIPYKKGKNGLFVNAGQNIAAKLISAACDAGVRILNMASFQDLIYSAEKIEGMAVAWKPHLSLQEEISAPISVSLKSQIVIDATGVDACVYQSLVKRKGIGIEKCAPADIRKSQDLLLEKTGMVYPGLAVSGMSVAAIYGIAPEGLTLCSSLLSGKKVAQEVGMFFAENYIGLEKKR